MSVLTDINSERYYCACFTFWESVENPQVCAEHMQKWYNRMQRCWWVGWFTAATMDYGGWDIASFVDWPSNVSDLKRSDSRCSLKGFYYLLCVQLQKGEPSEADEDDSPDVLQPAQLYAPKSLVLVSRLDHAEVFRVRGTHTNQNSDFFFISKMFNLVIIISSSIVFMFFTKNNKLLYYLPDLDHKKQHIFCLCKKTNNKTLLYKK